jgi:hypothetical protein
MALIDTLLKKQRRGSINVTSVPSGNTRKTAQSIIATCREHGVALRIDKNGDLVVGLAGAKANEPTQPWPSLLIELEAHLEEVARLVEAGWTLRVDFPKKGDDPVAEPRDAD